MTTFAPTFWFAIVRLMLIGSALVVVGAFEGIHDGRAGVAFLDKRPYRGWAISVFVVFGLGELSWSSR